MQAIQWGHCVIGGRMWLLEDITVIDLDLATQQA
jgi:hypothetical protein